LQVRSSSKTSGFRPDLVKLLQGFELELGKKRGGGGGGGGGGCAASVSLNDRIMQYVDGKGIMDGGGGIGNGVEMGSSSSSGIGNGSNKHASAPKAQSTLHVLSAVVLLVAVLYGCLYLVIGKRQVLSTL